MFWLVHVFPPLPLLETKQRQVKDTNSKLDMISGLHFEQPFFLVFPLKNMQFNNRFLIKQSGHLFSESGS